MSLDWAPGQVRRGTGGHIQDLVFLVLCRAWNDTWQVRDAGGHEWRFNSALPTELLNENFNTLGPRVSLPVIRFMARCAPCHWTGAAVECIDPLPGAGVSCPACHCDVTLVAWAFDAPTESEFLRQFNADDAMRNKSSPVFATYKDWEDNVPAIKIDEGQSVFVFLGGKTRSLVAHSITDDRAQAKGLLEEVVTNIRIRRGPDGIWCLDARP